MKYSMLEVTRLIEVVLDLGDNVHLALLRDGCIIKYTEFDYGKDVLDVLYAMLLNKGIQRLTVNLAGILSDRIYSGSFYFTKYSLLRSETYYLYPAGTVEKLAHLANVLGISDLIFTDRLLCYLNYGTNGCYVDSANNVLNVYGIKDGRLLDSVSCTQDALDVVLQRLCCEIGCTDLVNMTSMLNSELVERMFKNVFYVSEAKALRGLTQMAIILSNRDKGFTYEQFRNSSLCWTEQIAPGLQDLPGHTGNADNDCEDDDRPVRGAGLARGAKPANGTRTVRSSKPARSDSQDEMSDALECIQREKLNSDRKSRFSRILSCLLVLCFVVTAVLLVLTFKGRQLNEQLEKQYVLLQKQLQTVKNQSALATATDTESEGAAGLLQIISSAASSYESDTLSVDGITIQNGEMSLIVFYSDERAVDSLIEDIRSSFTCISNTDSGDTTKGHYRTVIFSI